MAIHFIAHTSNQNEISFEFYATPINWRPNESQTQFNRHFPCNVLNFSIVRFALVCRFCCIIALISVAIGNLKNFNGINLKFCNQFCLFVLHSRNYDQFIKLSNSSNRKLFIFLLRWHLNIWYDFHVLMRIPNRETFSPAKYKQKQKLTQLFKAISIKIFWWNFSRIRKCWMFFLNVYYMYHFFFVVSVILPLALALAFDLNAWVGLRECVHFDSCNDERERKCWKLRQLDIYRDEFWWVRPFLEKHLKTIAILDSGRIQRF